MHHVKKKKKKVLYYQNANKLRHITLGFFKKGVKTIRVSSDFAPDAALIEKK